MTEQTKLTTSPVACSFDGTGRYELNNGQIVPIYDNSCEHRECRTSAGIKNSEDSCGSWRWEKDGTIIGLGFKDHSPLYLKRKLSINEAHSIDIKEYKEFWINFKDLLGKCILYTAITIGSGYTVKNFGNIKEMIVQYFPAIEITVERPEILK